MMQNTEHTAAPLLVRGGRVHDAVHPEPQQIDLLLENGRIVAMGHELNVPADIAVLDAAGLDIFPGFVDAHTHIGLDGYGIGYEGCDYNEMNDIWTPQLRAIDGINPRDPSFAHAREAGITCVCTGPGSANVLGGTFTAIRIAKEFDVGLTLEHVTEGHLIVDELAKESNIPMAVGPSLTFASKFELQNKSWETPGVLAKAGCHVSIITDNSVIPQQYLPLCAGMAVKAGMDPFAALQAITINPARHIGIADRVGSIEVGKDADLVLTDGCPFEVMTNVKAVLINGAVVSQK